MENIESKKYVVLDVETNGLSSLENDLLSISLYKPDDGKSYDRFLPLELEDIVWTTNINGITEEMLKDKLPLTQEEFDSLIDEFELEERTILHYGRIDETFLRNYMKRHKIKGFEKLSFYNFKHDIISSKFSEGNITKDNLCRIYGIENIQEIHTGINDCMLEWKLFERMNGNKLIVLQNNVYEMNKEYIIPVSYLTTYPNFKYYIEDFPSINYELEEVYRLSIKNKKIKKFETNISGITIEHLINSMLNVVNVKKDFLKFQVENRRKLHQIGTLPSVIHEIPVLMNNDGTIRAIRQEDKKKVNEVNRVTEIIKEEIPPLISFIKENIFNNDRIMSQEMVLNDQDNVLAVCDLSNESSILEIKTFGIDINKIKYQLYYQSNGRNIYLLETYWNPLGLSFIIHKANIKEGTQRSRQDQEKRRRKLQNKLNNKDLEVVNYFNVDSGIEMKCKKCGRRWTTNYRTITSNPRCIYCFKEPQKEIIEHKENTKSKLEIYQEKLTERSNGRLIAINYYGAKEKLSVGCIDCGNVWKTRADHLLERPHCPNCKNNKN